MPKHNNEVIRKINRLHLDIAPVSNGYSLGYLRKLHKPNSFRSNRIRSRSRATFQQVCFPIITIFGIKFRILLMTHFQVLHILYGLLLLSMLDY